MRKILPLFLFFLISWAILAVGFHSLTQNNALGTDFYVFWNAGRTAVFEHGNPYSDDVSLQNQLAILRRPARPEEDQLGFAYPPFALLTVLPLLAVSYEWAQAIWIPFILLVLVSALLVACRRPRLSLTFLLFYQVFFGIVLGNFAILLAAILLALWAAFTRLPDLSLGPRSQAALGVLWPG
jgi:hypothetical protein